MEKKEKLPRTESRGMYSWWWNSHISPKNSKWLQENLTDMDVKVKSMIRLIEEDADSFARRAEMYYKKRPELMKMVEEFYRSYRAMAERYDHATGVIKQARDTMTEAFPDQVPSLLGDDTSTPNGEFGDEFDSCTERKTLKQFNDQPGLVGRVRRSLNFDELDEKEQRTHRNGNKISRESNSEEILVLKEAIAKLEAEKKAGLVQYQQSSDKLSQMETEIYKTREDFRMLTDHANKAENEVSILKEKLIALDAEKESKLQDCEKSVEKINERAKTSEIKVETLKGELDKLVIEKDAALDQYMNCLEIISILQNKLRLTEEDVAGLKERAKKSESEVEILKETISKLSEEKEAGAREYQQCLELISGLEQKLSSANEEIDNGFTKLKSSEEQCLELQRSNRSLQSELESLMSKFGTQTQELTEKQKEIGKLWACIEEERFRFLEAETAFQTLQCLHVQTQEELRDMASELQNRAHLLQVGETQNRSLQDEVVKVKEENKHLDELNLSSSLSVKDMQNEISSLMESKGKLEEEVELCLDQRNALQQKIYCLKEELNDLNKKHVSILDQVNELGLGPESLGSSVKGLRDENSCLKETCQRESSEKAVLLEKMEVLERLLVKNSLLETSLSDLNDELDAARGKIEILEQSCQSFLEDKSTLVTQLQETNMNLEMLSNNNMVLEEFISNMQQQLEVLEAKSNTLEDSCQLLMEEKVVLMSEKDGLASQLENTRIRPEGFEGIYEELEGRCVNLEKEKESTLQKVDELNISLEAERRENVRCIETSVAKMHLLQAECRQEKRDLDHVLDSVIANELEVFVLGTTARVLKENNCSLFTMNQKLLEASEKELLVWKQKDFEQQSEIRSLQKYLCKAEEENLESSVELSVLATWVRQVVLDLQNLEMVKNRIESEREALLMEREKSDISEEKRSLMDNILNLERKVNVLEEENNVLCSKVLALENLSLIFRIFADEKFTVFREIRDDRSELCDVNATLIEKLKESRSENVDLKERLHKTEDELNQMALQLQEAKEKINRAEKQKLELDEIVENLRKDMQREKPDISEEKTSLMDNIRHLEGKTNGLEEENYVLCSKVLALENLSLIFRIFVDEKLMVFREIVDDRNKLHDLSASLIGKLGESKIENVDLRERLHRTEDELSVEIESGRKLLNKMALQLQEAEEKISQAEKEKLELYESVENLRTDYNEIKTENNFLHEASEKLGVDLEKLRHECNAKEIEEENFHFVLQKKVNEINELEILGASIFKQLHHLGVSQLVYEHKFHELSDVCDNYMDQNAVLKSQLAAYGPEIVLLKECISSLENQTDIDIKFPNPENEELQDAKVTKDQSDQSENILNEDFNKYMILSSASDLHILTARLQAIVKATTEQKDLIVQEKNSLHSKLDDTIKHLEFLQSNQNEWHRRSQRPTSEITSEGEDTLLTKDIVLDQISDSSPYGLSKRQQEKWETSDPKKVTENIKSTKKQKGKFSTSDGLEKWEISKGSNESFGEGNRTKVLERLDSDVQKLENIQITVQDLKSKLEETEKGIRGKDVVKCEALKGQLEETGAAVLKLFELNKSLVKSINEMSFSDKLSFDLENDGRERRRRVSKHAQRMSEKIGRLQVEVQKLQFVLLKVDDVKDKKSLKSVSKRTVLKDYLYGIGHHKKKTVKFCACVQPSTVEG